ncbi:MAG: tetratricopeptide repeat protein [Pseudomonadota bacterium]|jgi:TolA-binding protein
MSMIHDAIKELERSDSPSQESSQLAAAKSKHPARAAWLSGAMSFGVVVITGTAGWWFWSGSHRASLPSPASPPAISVAPGTAPPATAVPPAHAGPASLQQAAPLPPPVAASASSAVADSSPAVAKDAAPRRQSAVAKTPTRPQRSTAVPAAKKPAEEMPIEQRYASFMQALRIGDKTAAESHLASLRRALPADSLSLQRMEAWYLLQDGQANAAAEKYRAILERVPGDEEASINLASILVQTGQREAARQVLDEARRMHPDSEDLRNALAGFSKGKTP